MGALKTASHQWLGPCLLGGTALLSSANALAADTSYSVSLLSDYRWRGVSLSDESASLQTEASVSIADGVSAWAGLNSVSDEYGGAEVDLGASVTRTALSVDWTIGADQYFYAGEEALDYFGLSAYGEKAFGRTTLQVGVEYSPAQRNLAGQDTYVWSALSLALSDTISLNTHAGRDDGSFASVDDAVDWGVGAEKAFDALSVSLDYADAEGADSSWVLGAHYGW